jgi:hypothetical protein
MANSSDLYSYQGQEPSVLPHRITLSDGRSRTDSSTFTEEELNDVGITGPYKIPQYDSETQRIHWNSETLSYVIEDKTDEELWEPIRRERNRLLAESDWTMTADAPENLNFREWEIYRQRLRDLPSFYEDPREVIFPKSPEDRSDDDFDQPRLHENKLLWRIRELESIVKTLRYRVIKPFPSWTWSDTELKWSAPIAPPNDYDESNYRWNETDQEWVVLESTEEV